MLVIGPVTYYYWYNISNMTQHIKGFFQEIYNSLFNFDAYRIWQGDAFGKNLGYLFKLLLLTTFLSVLPIFFLLITQSFKLPDIVSQGRQTLQSAFPKELVLTIKNGQLSTNVKEPYYYDLPKSWAGGASPTTHLITIATDSQVEDYERYESVVLVTKNAVVYPKSGSSQKEVLFLRDIKDGKFGYQDYTKGLSQLDPYWNYIYPVFWFLVISLVLFVPFLGAAFGLLGQLLYLVFLGGVLWLIAKPLGFNKNFGQIYRILMHASTLPILFFTGLGILNLTPPIPMAHSLVLGVFFLAICFQIKKDTASFHG